MKKFICGVANCFGYDSNDNLLFSSKTMLTDSIDITTDKQEIRAGYSNQLQLVYFHTSAMNISLEESQFNLSMISKALGSSITTGASVWTEETCTLTAGAGSVTGTPIATSSGNIYGWAELSDGTTERFTFSTKAFTLTGQSTGDVVVRYYETDASARTMEINANIIPSVVRIVLDAQLFSGDSTASSSLIGKVLVEVPNAQLDGAVSLELSSSGVSKTPLKASALADSTGVYATITEVVDSANWYDNVFMICVEDDTPALTHPATSTLVVWAIPNNGDAPFIAPVASLTFSSGTTGTATIGANTGIITTAANGTTVLSVYITDKNTVTTTATLNVS